MIPGQEGKLYLTQEQTIQTCVEHSLDYAMDKFSCDAAWAIVEDVRTGAILGMAWRSNGGSNEARGEKDERHRWNRAAGSKFEPGTLLLPLTVAAGINEGVITTNEVFDCEMGRWMYLGATLKDFHPYGKLDVVGILQKSSKIGAVKMAVMLGERRLERYLREFGLGRRTGIELSGEEEGELLPAAKWNKTDIVQVATGYGVSVTALQMLNALCCLGNDGILLKPHLVKRVEDSTGRVLEERRPETLGRPVSVQTARQMREMMLSVTQPGGAGTKAAVDGYHIAGKTGDAEMLKNGEHVNMASFMGLVPAETPRVGIIVVLDNPHPLQRSALSAAEVFRMIAEPLLVFLPNTFRTSILPVPENKKYCS